MTYEYRGGSGDLVFCVGCSFLFLIHHQPLVIIFQPLIIIFQPLIINFQPLKVCSNRMKPHTHWIEIKGKKPDKTSFIKSLRMLIPPFLFFVEWGWQVRQWPMSTGVDQWFGFSVGCSFPEIINPIFPYITWNTIFAVFTIEHRFHGFNRFLQIFMKIYLC